MPSNADTSTFDILLTNLLAEQRPGMSPIGEALAPLNPVTSLTGRYRKRKRSDLEDVNANPVRPAGKLIETVESTGYEEGTYNVVDYALRGSVPIEASSGQLSANESLDALVTEAIDIQNRIIFQHEKDVHALAWTAPVPETALTDTASKKWDAATTDIKLDIENAKLRFYKANGFMPTHIVIPNEVFIRIKSGTNDMFESIKFTQTGVVVEEIISALTGIPNVLIPMQLQDSGATTAINGKDLLWKGDKVRLYGIDSRVGRQRTSSFLKTLNLNSSDFPWFAVRRKFNEDNKSTEVDVSAYWDIVSPNRWAVSEITDVLT